MGKGRLGWVRSESRKKPERAGSITLLPQFLGMYRLNVDGVEIYVIVTRNVFSHRLSVYRKYDLKVRVILLICIK